MREVEQLRYLLALARNELGTVPCDEASQALDRLQAEIERLRSRVEELESSEGLMTLAVMQQERDYAKTEAERLRAENEQLRRGAPLGPIVGIETIVEQQLEITRLQRLLQTVEAAKAGGGE